MPTACRIQAMADVLHSEAGVVDRAGDCHIGIFKAMVGSPTANGSTCNVNRGWTWRALRNW